MHILEDIEQDFLDISEEFASLSAFRISENPIEFCDFVPQNWWVRRIVEDDDIHHPKKNVHGFVQIGISCHATTHVVKVGWFCVQAILMECLTDLASLVNCTVAGSRGRGGGQMVQSEVGFIPSGCRTLKVFSHWPVRNAAVSG